MNVEEKETEGKLDGKLTFFFGDSATSSASSAFFFFFFFSFWVVARKMSVCGGGTACASGLLFFLLFPAPLTDPVALRFASGRPTQPSPPSPLGRPPLASTPPPLGPLGRAPSARLSRLLAHPHLTFIFPALGRAFVPRASECVRARECRQRESQ